MNRNMKSLGVAGIVATAALTPTPAFAEGLSGADLLLPKMALHKIKKNKAAKKGKCFFQVSPKIDLAKSSRTYSTTNSTPLTKTPCGTRL